MHFSDIMHKMSANLSTHKAKQNSHYFTQHGNV